MHEIVIPAEILKRITNINSDFSNGSTNIAREVLKIFDTALKSGIDQENIEQLLLKVKPAMAAPKNIIKFAAEKYKNSDNNNYVYEQILQLMDRAKRDIINIGIDKIFRSRDHQKIITCSYSGTVLNLFRSAKQSGIEFEVIAIESLWKDKSFGKQMAEKCGQHNIICDIVPDENISHAITRGTAILIGADMLIRSGGAVNGIPSLELARQNSSLLPFFVIAESFKYSNNIHTEDGFCFVPSEFITFVISDNLFE